MTTVPNLAPSIGYAKVEVKVPIDILILCLTFVQVGGLELELTPYGE